MRANLTCEMRGPVQHVDYNPPRTFSQQLVELNALNLTLPPVDCPITHHFARGLYAREMFLPAGTCIVGRIHKFEQITILSQGEMTVVGSSEGRKRIKAPFTIVARAGEQRAAIIHTDCVVTTIVATNVTDPDLIVDALTVTTYEEYLRYCACLEDKST